MRALVLIALIACGGVPAPRPLVVYRNAADAFELHLSASVSPPSCSTRAR